MDIGAKVSVIMPVHNAKDYIEETIKSVLNQTYTNLELLLIDDGATDGSSEICDEYAKKDPRVVVIHQQNGGISKARNCGLNHAKGKYVAFCDHDDLYASNCLMTAVSAAEESNASVIKFSHHVEIWAQGRLERKNDYILPAGDISTEKLCNQYSIYAIAMVPIWNGIYLREPIERKNIRFDETIKCGFDDRIFCMQLLANMRNFKFVSDVLYLHYVRKGQSTSRKYNPKIFEEAVKTYRQGKDLFETLNAFKTENWICYQEEYLSICFNHLLYSRCKMNLREKQKKMRSLTASDAINLNCSKINWFCFFRKEPKKVIKSILYNLGMSWILLLYRQLRQKQEEEKIGQ